MHYYVIFNPQAMLGTLGASSLQKKIILLSKYSIAKSSYCWKYNKYTSEPKFKFKFSTSVL